MSEEDQNGRVANETHWPTWSTDQRYVSSTLAIIHWWISKVAVKCASAKNKGYFRRNRREWKGTLIDFLLLRSKVSKMLVWRWWIRRRSSSSISRRRRVFLLICSSFFFTVCSFHLLNKRYPTYLYISEKVSIQFLQVNFHPPALPSRIHCSPELAC